MELLCIMTTAAATVETIRKLNSSFSLTQQTTDYHIFGSLKNALRGRRFLSDEEVKDTVHIWHRAQPKTFFAGSIRKFVERSNKCV
jgi:hypothetical protein